MDNSLLLEKLKPHIVPILLAVVGIGFVLYGFLSLTVPKKDKPDILFEAASTQSDTGLAKDEKAKSMITVDVEGAVQKPGVYTLASDARAQDALISAGGLSDHADREKVSKGLNLAAKLTDGGKIYIPFVGEQAMASSGNSSTGSVLGTESGSAININTASASELDKLQGVGMVTAQKIINNRPYGAIEELVTKKVVSQKVFDQIKEKISL